MKSILSISFLFALHSSAFAQDEILQQLKTATGKLELGITRLQNSRNLLPEELDLLQTVSFGGYTDICQIHSTNPDRLAWCMKFEDLRSTLELRGKEKIAQMKSQFEKVLKEKEKVDKRANPYNEAAKRAAADNDQEMEAYYKEGYAKVISEFTKALEDPTTAVGEALKQSQSLMPAVQISHFDPIDVARIFELEIQRLDPLAVGLENARVGFGLVDEDPVVNDLIDEVFNVDPPRIFEDSNENRILVMASLNEILRSAFSNLSNQRIKIGTVKTNVLSWNYDITSDGAPIQIQFEPTLLWNNPGTQLTEPAKQPSASSDPKPISLLEPTSDQRR